MHTINSQNDKNDEVFSFLGRLSKHSSHQKIPLLFILILFLATNHVEGRIDFLTDNPQLIISVKDNQWDKLDEITQKKTEIAKEWIQTYFKEWQSRFCRLRRHVQINLVPTQGEIHVQGTTAEGVWSWKSFLNEEGTIVSGVSGDLYININSRFISQEALVAHEASHAFLLAYQPSLLDTGNEYTFYNEGLAELFSVQYEPKVWRGWDKLLVSKRLGESLGLNNLSNYGRRIVNVLLEKSRSPHDVGFFFLYVMRNGKVDLDQDLKKCRNSTILSEVQQWISTNSNELDLQMIRE